MKIARVEISTYRLPFRRPLRLKTGTLTERRGYLMRLTSDSGAVGWGDVAPLPGFSEESFEATEAILRQLMETIGGTTVAFDPRGGVDRLLAETKFWVRRRSVRCGLETALLDLCAAETGRSIAELLAPNPTPEVLLNGLVTADEDAIARAHELKNQGFRTIKIKVGGDVTTEAARVRAVRREIGDGIALRLDANLAWKLDDAVRFAREVAECDIEYIEEPLTDPARLAEFVRSTGLPVALDESTLYVSARELKDHAYAAAIVLKPTVLGGISETAKLALAARELNMKVVISSSFESGIGIAALAQCAAAYSQADVAAGLDTLDRFEHDLLTEPVDTTGGRIVIAQAARAARTVDRSLSEAWVDESLLDTLIGRTARPAEDPLLIDERRVITRRHAAGMIEFIARKLTAAGIGPGDRIAVISRNCVEYPLFLLACLRVGAVAVLLSPRYPEDSLKAMIASTGCRAVARMERSAKSASTEYGLRVFELPPLPSASDESAPVPHHDAGLGRTGLERPWTICFTSGSTGLPKAVLHTAGNHHYSALGSNAVLPVGPGDRWLLSLPLYHVGGLGILCRCVLGRAAVVFERSGVDMAEQIVRDDITHLSLVPTQLRRLLEQADLSGLKASLKAILLGGAPIPPELLDRALAAGLPVYSTYGLTETASQVATAPPELPKSARILPYRQVRIDSDGVICVRGATLFSGYITPEGLVRPVDADGWFRTGDFGRLDSRRCLEVLGRVDNMFISGGENIHPEPIEAALSGLAGIEEAVVVPVTDDEFGRRPVAFLRYQDDLNLSTAESDLTEEARFAFDHDSLSARLEKTLPRFMLPVAYYPWPHGYSPAGIKLDRLFFRDLAERLHRTRR